jgi:hypothetical protein
MSRCEVSATVPWSARRHDDGLAKTSAISSLVIVLIVLAPSFGLSDEGRSRHAILDIAATGILAWTTRHGVGHDGLVVG